LSRLRKLIEDTVNTLNSTVSLLYCCCLLISFVPTLSSNHEKAALSQDESKFRIRLGVDYFQAFRLNLSSHCSI